MNDLYKIIRQNYMHKKCTDTIKNLKNNVLDIEYSSFFTKEINYDDHAFYNNND